ncbi:hypothetical protein [Paracoccus sp. (in: a-proteobacteria)]|jgi:hypothetical protein
MTVLQAVLAHALAGLALLSGLLLWDLYGGAVVYDALISFCM